VLTILSILATRRLKDVPGPLQNVAEAAVEKLEDYFGGTLGYDNMRRYFGIFATLFIFIVVSNYSGLLPTAGETFSVPTASISVTAALAVIAFFTTHTIGIQRNGLGGYAKSFLKPIAFLLPLTLLDQIVRPFSLAIRLYGNIYAEEMVTAQLRKMFPVLLPLVMQILGLLFCLIQAMVFTMLTAVYVHEAIGDDE
jgi:F-type H+-transporting ATPase subunit a